MGAYRRIDHRGEAARYALAAKRGVLPPNALQGMARDMFDVLTEPELEEMALPMDRGRPGRFDNVPL